MQNMQLSDDFNENDPKYKCCCGCFDVVVSTFVSSVESRKLDCAIFRDRRANVSGPAVPEKIW
jgi:hypothetical protein